MFEILQTDVFGNFSSVPWGAVSCGFCSHCSSWELPKQPGQESLLSWGGKGHCGGRNGQCVTWSCLWPLEEPCRVLKTSFHQPRAVSEMALLWWDVKHCSSLSLICQSIVDALLLLSLKMRVVLQLPPLVLNLSHWCEASLIWIQTYLGFCACLLVFRNMQEPQESCLQVSCFEIWSNFTWLNKFIAVGGELSCDWIGSSRISG